MKIVETRRNHLKPLVQIGKQHWFYENWINTEYMSNTLDKKGFHFTAMLNGKVAGGVMIIEEDYPKYWIYFLAVDKSCQRRGIGTALMKQVEKKLKKKCVIFTDLEKNDVSGLKFYRKSGFIEMGKVREWFEGERKGIIMAKKVR